MDLVIGEAGAGNADYACDIGGAIYFRGRARAGLNIEPRNGTRGIAARSYKYGLTIFRPAQGEIARL